MNSDLALIRMEIPPPVWFRPYFAGWSVLPQIGNKRSILLIIIRNLKKPLPNHLLQLYTSDTLMIPPEVLIIGAPLLDGWLRTNEDII